MPEDWQPSETHRSFAATHGIDLELAAIAFRGWAEGKLAASWNGRFTTWLANDARRAKENLGRGRMPAPQRGAPVGVDPRLYGTSSPLLKGG